uniref:Uncharacterized protein n=1 Tax=Rhinopithecus bieti TaxID=61621 RepID=A0A2K6KD62_RHIBE
RRYLGDTSVEPNPLQMPTFPPDYGFTERKEPGDDGRAAEAPAAGLLCPLPHPAAQVQARQLPQLPGLQAGAARLALLRAPRLRDTHEGV